MAYTGKDFEHFKIKNASIQLLNPDGTSEPGVRFGCMGSLDQTNNTEEYTKTCEGVVIGTETVLKSAVVNVAAHVVIDILRSIFGLSNEGLRPGVWSYGTRNTGRRFIFTAEIENMRKTESKLVAYPNCSTTGGFAFSIDNAAATLAQMTVNFNALADAYDQVYYEAIKSDLPEYIANTWHTMFSRHLVENRPPVRVQPLILSGVAATGQQPYRQNMFRGYNTL
mgnify:CR=1 FL=1